MLTASFQFPHDAEATWLVAAATTDTCGPMRRPECCIHEKMIKNYHEPKCQLAKWYVARVTTCFVSGLLPRCATLPILPSTNKTVNPLQTDGSRRSSHFFFPFFFADLSKDSLNIKMETWILSGLETGDWSPS